MMRRVLIIVAFVTAYFAAMLSAQTLAKPGKRQLDSQKLEEALRKMFGDSADIQILPEQSVELPMEQNAFFQAKVARALEYIHEDAEAAAASASSAKSWALDTFFVVFVFGVLLCPAVLSLMRQKVGMDSAPIINSYREQRHLIRGGSVGYVTVMQGVRTLQTYAAEKAHNGEITPLLPGAEVWDESDKKFEGELAYYSVGRDGKWQEKVYKLKPESEPEAVPA